MKRNLFIVILAICLMITLGCSAAKQAEVKEIKTNEQEPPAQGVALARAADRIAITNGPKNPVRKVIWQKPQARPCWAMTTKTNCVNLPGKIIFVGISSGAATEKGAILNAYQNAIEALTTHVAKNKTKDSLAAYEKIRKSAYNRAGIFDNSYRLQKEFWVQKWQERTRSDTRTYFRAFVLLAISEKEIAAMKAL